VNTAPDDRPTPRQQALLLRSAALREQLATESGRLQPPLRLADRVRDTWHWLQAHPELPLAAGAVVALLRPRRAWRWGRRLWWGWQTWQRMRRKTTSPN
jgi:hypothetical protein